ncbi:MAG: nucleotidyltransferase family protein, partial [Elusimicrobiota bacterium]|nr:nucleotidyltransferase family protein [Elusimicrobiota bacterium]
NSMCNKNSAIQTVILAGGLGTRLRPITHHIPKPMVIIKGKPFLYYLLEYLKTLEFRNILILVGYQGEKIIDYFSDGKKFGLLIKYSIEETPLGTGGGLKKAENLIENEFLMINGDTYLPIDYNVLVQEFYRRKKKGLVTVFENTINIPLKNNVTVDKDMNILRYDKRSNDPELNYIESGVSVFSKEILKYIKKGQVVSLEEKIYPILIKEGEMTGFKIYQRPYDIGTPEGLKEFEEKLSI